MCSDGMATALVTQPCVGFREGSSQPEKVVFPIAPGMTAFRR